MMFDKIWQKLKINKDFWMVAFAIILLIFAVAFFIQKQYWQSFLIFPIILILFKINELERFIFSPNKVEAKFDRIREEKIKEEIRGNKEKITKEKILSYKDVEDKVLEKLHKKIGGSLEKGVRLPVSYTPDAIISTANEITLVEVKNLKHTSFTKTIIEQGVKYLKDLLKDWESIGYKPIGYKLRGILVLTTNSDIKLDEIDKPDNIDIEIYKMEE